MRAVLLAAAAAVAIAQPVSAREIDSGRIALGQGMAGAKLDMTRAEVVRALGRPLADHGGVMSYQHARHGIFDVYRYGDTRRVRMFVLSSHGSAWKLRDGNPIFEKGAIERLYRHYGDRVQRRRDPNTGDPYYAIFTRYHHRPVLTEFDVNRFSRKHALVRNIFILFTDRAA